MSKLSVSELKRLLRVDGRIGFVNITPDIAKKILEGNNERNRVLSMTRVYFLRKQFDEGDYFLETSCIGFNKEGVLTDGQHRLKAISLCETGKKFEIGVMFGVEQKMDMDTGKNRSLKDNAKIFKECDPRLKDPKALVCLDVVKDFLCHVDGHYKYKKLTQKKYVTIANSLADELIACNEAGLFKRIVGLTTVSVFSAFFSAYLCGVPLDVLKYIRDTMELGTFNGTTDNPIYALVRKLSELKGSGRELSTVRYCSTQDCIQKVLRKQKSKSVAQDKYHYVYPIEIG